MDNLEPEMTDTQKLFVAVSKQGNAIADLQTIAFGTAAIVYFIRL